MKIFFVTAFLVATISAWSQPGSDSLIGTLLKHPHQDTNRVNLLIRVADELSRESNFNDAFKLQEEASNLSIRLWYARGAAESKLYRGIIHYRKGEFHSAVPALRLAVSQYEMIPDQNGAALSYHWLGNSHYAISQFDRALENYLKAYSLREQTGDKKGMAFTLTNIGNIYYDQKEYKKALEYYERSLALKRELKDERSIAFSYNNIGNIYTGMKKYGEAMQFYNNALVIFEKIENNHGIAYTLGSIGTVYEKEGHFSEALKALGKAAPILEQEGDLKALAEACNHIGEIEMQLKLYKRAAASLTKAQRLAESAGVASELIENYFRFARLDSALGNMTEAYVWMKKYTALKEKIFNSEKSSQIAQMQSAFDTERKDRTIEMLAKEKDYQESQKVTQRLIFAAGLIILLIILLGLIYFLRQKHKTNRILNEQKNHSEELNHLKDKLFSIIAHDLRGPLHSLKALLNLATANNISEAELKYLLGTIGHNTEYTTNLVDNLLMWAKDNLQGSSITPQAFDLTELVQNNIQLLNSQAEKKGIKIQYSRERSVSAYADRNMIDLVLRNILSNAIKFTPDSGVVTVSVGTEHSYTTVSIRDTGVGIRKELQGKLFGNQNYSTPGTANEKGTGLGLILCKEFVEKNGGKISVKSAERSGSTFTFTIPSASVKELAGDGIATEFTYALQ